MSQKVERYEGEGKVRKPIYATEGPASVASDPMGTIGATKAPAYYGDVPEALTGGAGPVERRKATREELAAARAREDQPSHLTVPTLAKPVVFSPTQRATPAPEPPEEEPPVSEPSAEYSDPMTGVDVEALATSRGNGAEWNAIGVLADAVLELIEADTERTMAATRWVNARAALDLAYRALDEPVPVVTTPIGGGPEERKPPTSGIRPGQAADRNRRAERVMASMARHGDDMGVVAAELGMKKNAVSQVVKFARRRAGA